MSSIRYVLYPIVLFISSGAATAGQYAPNDGRLLASNCFQCHGVDGAPAKGGFDDLAGSNEVLEELRELAGPGEGEGDEELMAVHAKAFAALENTAAIQMLSDYFASLPRKKGGSDDD